MSDHFWVLFIKVLIKLTENNIAYIYTYFFFCCETSENQNIKR